MAKLDAVDIIVLIILLAGSIAYFTKGIYWAVPKDPYALNSGSNDIHRKSRKTRDIVEKMAETGKNCVIFYGSQTGTAEDFATRLAKEGKARFGLETMAADLEDYDYENLDHFPEDKVAIFVLSTYGEGEPTDNAVDFYQFITGQPTDSFTLGKEHPLESFNFVAFGLGNNTYEHFNSMVRNVTAALESLGAQRIGKIGEGDDGAGTMEEDFLAWKDPMWAAVAEKLNLVEREAVYEPVFAVNESEVLTGDSHEVFLGEPNKMHLATFAKGPFNAQNPYIAPIVASRELFNDPHRNCLHLELDISDSNLDYQTGDHVAVWPTNSDRDVDQFLKITGLLSKRNTVINVKALDQTSRVPFPTPTTYDAVSRYYMEINAAVSRQFIATLAPFAPTDDVKTEMIKLGNDKDYFQIKVSSRYLNIAQVLEDISGGREWNRIPFSAFIEGLNKLQPRYYSISSSSLVEKKKISITAVVESLEIPGRPTALKGVTTNYLLALKREQSGESFSDTHFLTYQVKGPRNKYDGFRIPIHIRHSNFKLPSDPSKPIIMVGPGTGVAPFRGFIRERAAKAKSRINVGNSLLFFGCRRQTEDFLYKDEWEEYKRDLGDKFTLVTAFSRESTPKAYVQDRLLEHAQVVNQLLLSKAYFYVCGDAANMAKAVLSTLHKVLSEQRNISEEKAEEIVKNMRALNQYQEDVWS
ncbi:putative nadph-cytochrome p450 reductase [Erysiphe necator]|uniref:NADPH--cytochrome P450 reductase n=1 Tax=Uncinula necator TaxID=52586 RepID=A0A0B1P387_UNCNE|nr:putative nadph-cytochrome p450 reductase [Erysiphe necator]